MRVLGVNSKAAAAATGWDGLTGQIETPRSSAVDPVGVIRWQRRDDSIALIKAFSSGAATPSSPPLTRRPASVFSVAIVFSRPLPSATDSDGRSLARSLLDNINFSIDCATVSCHVTLSLPPPSRYLLYTSNQTSTNNMHSNSRTRLRRQHGPHSSAMCPFTPRVRYHSLHLPTRNSRTPCTAYSGYMTTRFVNTTVLITCSTRIDHVD